MSYAVTHSGAATGGLARPLWRAAGALLIAGFIAASWLVFPYFVHGSDLLRTAGSDSRLLKAGQVSRYLSRSLVDHPDLELVATFATEDFFQFVDDETVRGLRPDRNLVFFVTETVHTGELPESPPAVVLNAGGQRFLPAITSAPDRADHHRVTTYSFPKARGVDLGVDLDAAASLRLDVSGAYLGSERPLTFLTSWQAPYTLPPRLRAGASVPVLAVLAIGAGLLSSVLTPCLLQMMFVFGATTAGFATAPQVPGNPRSASPELVRRKLRLSAAAFVLGFTALCTAAGALIGSVGQAAQLVLAQYRGPLSVTAGALVIALGLWLLARGSRSVVCRIPAGRLDRVTTVRDAVASGFAAIGAALGCTVCFGGAIIGTLVVYVGIIGDPLIGAGILFVFSLGFALPLIGSAYVLSRSASFLAAVVSYARPITYVSSAVIVAFGVVLITDNFHVVSDLIYPYLGLR
jgi:cytochrome c-type biogenesis protein